MYEYKATVTRVVDGDTIDVIIDLGFKVFIKERVRLFGIDAPEPRTKDLVEKEKGLAATAFLTELLTKQPEVVLQSTKVKRGKFGRFIATVFVEADGMPVLNINEWMVDSGFAVYKEY